MSPLRSYVVIWSTDPARPEITHQGELLACGPVKDVVEAAARHVPAWITIAGFADDDTAKKWFESAAMALMAWPTSKAVFAWYESADHLPYRNNRYSPSDATVVSVAALGFANEGTHR
jgi:uncharacterized protein (DUF1330 family)